MSSPSNVDRVRARPYLGTIVTIRAGGTSSDCVQRGIDRAFAEIARVHALMSFHDEASEISIINRLAHRAAVVVSQDTFAVLTLAIQVFQASSGAFDVTVAKHLARWGLLPSRGRAASDATMADVELLTGRRVRFAKKLLIDLGGIAKGYAVDRAVNALREAGVPRGTVNAGGDLRAFGPEATMIHVRDPRQPQVCAPLAAIRESALATSALYFSRRHVHGRVVSAIVDPHDGQPCRTSGSTSVIAPTCVVADALTKVVLVRESRALDVLRQFDASAIVVRPDGRVRTFEVCNAA